MTERERDVLRQVSAGKSNTETATALSLSVATAKTHVSRHRHGPRSRLATSWAENRLRRNARLGGNRSSLTTFLQEVPEMRAATALPTVPTRLLEQLSLAHTQPRNPGAC